jgi:hypothetical protein
VTLLDVVVFDVHSHLAPYVCLFTMLSVRDTSCPTRCSVTLIAIFRLEHLLGTLVDAMKIGNSDVPRDAESKWLVERVARTESVVNK